MKTSILIFVILSSMVFTSCSLLGGSDGPVRPDIPGKIVFAADAEDGSSQIFTMKADGSDLQQITHLENDEAYQPSWSPDGTQIVFSTSLQSSSNGFSLFIMDADGANLHPMHDRPRSPIPTPGNHARWSPDGGKIAFDRCVNCQVGTNIQLFVYTFAEDTVRQLTHTSYTTNSNPAWSPDGNRIAFASDRDHPKVGGTDIYTIDNSNVTRLTETGNAGRQLWYSNGQDLLYWSENNLYKLNLVSMQAQLISVEVDAETGFRPIALYSDGGKILLHVFSYANPREEQSLRVLDLVEKKLNTIYSNSSFQGADWYISPKN